MFWISSGKDLALWMNLLRWPIWSAIAVTRAGKSLELHPSSIYSGARPATLATQAITEAAIKNPIFLPQGLTMILSFRENLRMLAVKTTCKDRWRQIL